MATSARKPVGIIVATVIILATVAYLAVTSISSTKQYYVTIAELQHLGDKAYTRHLRVAGNVAPGSIKRSGMMVNFALMEQGKLLQVSYQGSEPPPDTFKDDSQALAVGTYGHDGVFHATELQAKCASKYAPVDKKPGVPATRLPCFRLQIRHFATDYKTSSPLLVIPAGNLRFFAGCRLRHE